MNDSHVNATVAAISQLLLAVFGVDYYAMLWAFVGSLLALGQAQQMSRGRAVIYVFMSTLIGAALASGCFAFFNLSAQPVKILLSLVGGVGSHLIIITLVRGVLARIQSALGGDHHEPFQSSR